MSGCVNWENRQLWKPVDNPVDNPPDGELVSPPHAPPFPKDLSLLATVNALDEAVTCMDARIQAVEYAIDHLIAICDSPLTPEQLLERLRLLKDELAHR